MWHKLKWRSRRSKGPSEADLYLDLLKRCLINLIYEDPPLRMDFSYGPHSESQPPEGVFCLFDRQRRMNGKDWPSIAHTMIGMRRLNHIQYLVEDILANKVPGDLIETGVWRGGSTIFMRGVLKAYGVTDRTVWVADSFMGFPNRDQVSSRSFRSPELAEIRPGPLPAKAQQIFKHLMRRTSHAAVRDHFARYGLLDEQVQFLPGWFRDTLPSAPITKLALLRLDGDLYDSTYEALEALYPKLAFGGYAVVDDYGTFAECREAVHDYLAAIKATVNIQLIDDGARFWQKVT